MRYSNGGVFFGGLGWRGIRGNKDLFVYDLKLVDTGGCIPRFLCDPLMHAGGPGPSGFTLRCLTLQVQPANMNPTISQEQLPPELV